MTIKNNKDLSGLIIRPFKPKDQEAVVALGEASGMGTLTDFENLTVIMHKTDVLIGFIRIHSFSGVAYVNPVVIDNDWQGLGLGKLLMKRSLECYRELRFVARGSAVPFYESLGCTTIPWEMIAPEIAADCDGCDQAKTCNPLPMRMME